LTLLESVFFKDFLAGMVSVSVGVFGIVFIYQLANADGKSENGLSDTTDTTTNSSVDVVPTVQPTIPIVPAVEPEVLPPEQAENQLQESVIFYQVQTGDTLTALAQRFNVGIQEIAQVNGITNYDWIIAGTVIKIPQAATPVMPETSITYYTVRPGDNLWSIAQTFGVDVNTLAQANHIFNPALIHPGDVLEIVSS
ncbi:MAG TPA: LysM peptidoglycan-binding domain-containing protein, partial [Patescibacteria group bacterium]